MNKIMSEFEFINRLKSLITPNQGAYPDALNFTDDICILGKISHQTLICSQDTLCEDIHFFKDDPLDAIVKKAIRTNVSDITCKGGKPYGMMFSICLPKRYHNQQAQDLIYTALEQDLSLFNIPLLGGDTTNGKTLTISITIFGLCDHPIPLRKNVSIGDAIYVTGTLGLSKIGLDIRHNKPETFAIKDKEYYKNAYLYPNPPLNLGIALSPYMNAAIDISDGLIGDLNKMLLASDKNIGYDLDETTIPIADIDNQYYALECALYGGDDYQILFTTHYSSDIFYNLSHEYGVKITKIGTISHQPHTLTSVGFSHL
jgi:thiamine-monophosphate kinase